jgi:hypothetical protein
MLEILVVSFLSSVSFLQPDLEWRLVAGWDVPSPKQAVEIDYKYDDFENTHTWTAQITKGFSQTTSGGSVRDVPVIAAIHLSDGDSGDVDSSSSIALAVYYTSKERFDLSTWRGDALSIKVDNEITRHDQVLFDAAGSGGVGHAAYMVPLQRVIEIVKADRPRLRVGQTTITLNPDAQRYFAGLLSGAFSTMEQHDLLPSLPQSEEASEPSDESESKDADSEVQTIGG